MIITPKGLLRLREATSALDALSSGGFRAVIDDPLMSSQRDTVSTLLLCSGRIYYDLVLHPQRAAATDLAIARVELLAPLPVDAIIDVVSAYPNLEQLVWVQEEPANMGGWGHLERAIGLRRPSHVRWEYAGRPRRASPSEGYAGSHHHEQARIVAEALGYSKVLAQQNAAAGAQPTPTS